MPSVCIGMKKSIFWMTALFITGSNVNTQQQQFPQQRTVNNVCPTYRDYFTMRNNPKCWYDFAAEDKVVKTTDGYILTVFRIPRIGSTKPPVFMLHGVQSSAAIFVSLGKSSMVFCGTHDMPLRGKQADEGVLLDLLKLRIDSGDNKLKSHFEKCRRNAIYTSPRIQNELINLCGEVIQENVISEVRKTMAYSILADETADVSGKEQLSIGVRFYDESKSKIREEFVGFVELKAQNASAIAEAIDNFLISSNLSKEDCVGFGFDGCSTMAGKEGGVQAILRKKYPRALYFHCSSHKLNLVVNDANAVPEIRNTVATVKDVITFFRESTTRRNYAPNLSRLCETRWSEKYKSIRKFSQHFSELVKSLETLSVEGNYATRKSAYQLHSAVTKPVFIVSLQTIAKYSAVIEPVVNALQAKSIDMISVGKHIKNIKDILRNDREFPDRISNEILQKARAVAMDLNIEISVPRLAHKQTHRSNPPSDNDNEYWRRSLIIPYIDSLISSLNIRFSQENTPAFALSRLHPLYMTKTSIADLHKNAESFQEFYNLDITGELNLWHNLWVTKALSDDQLKDIEVVDLFKEANIFYPAVRKALIILSTIPCTTATVERSFSTLRRVKTVDDIALKDVPAMLQLVTYHAGHRGKIIYIGHSLGTTAGIIFASEYPSTAANTIGLLVLLTPAYKLPNMRSPYRFIFPLLYPALELSTALNLVQIVSRGNVRSLTRPVCLSSPFLMVACLTILNLFLGPFTQIAPETIPVYFNQIPGGTSLKSISYLTEATRNQFRKYNYGTGRNRFLYGNDTPPDYDIKKIKVPVYIMFARHDWSISREDCISFYRALPREVRYGMYEIRNRNFNHYDFLFGRDSKKLVTDILIQVLDRYVAQQNNDKTSS
nr:unnamed protein product [Callosobruchus analis]